MLGLETTKDCLEEARNILAEAEKVTNREEHASVWDKKVEVLRAVNSAFETGYYTGDAYNELREAKSVLHRAETVAGKRALQTYAKRL